MVKRIERGSVQALVSKAPVEALDMPIVGGLAGPGEVEVDAREKNSMAAGRPMPPSSLNLGAQSTEHPQRRKGPYRNPDNRSVLWAL